LHRTAKGIAAHNTDGAGALQALKDAGARVKQSKTLLIGAGGAARAIAYTLQLEGSEIFIANRSIPKAQQLAACVGGLGFGLEELPRLVSGMDIIVNATSLGMREGDPRLFDGRLLHSGQLVFDIVYNRNTELLADARSAGAGAVDGVMMLVYQGSEGPGDLDRPEGSRGCDGEGSSRGVGGKGRRDRRGS